MQEYQGVPPNCRPECVVSAECPANKACLGMKCSDPCVGKCGQNARCHVINHSPICSCLERYTGDPFSRCYPLTVIAAVSDEPKNPCLPSPCGPFSECRNSNGVPSCSCQLNYIGAPPACRPECTINSDCPSNAACINQKCKDPCPGSCGLNARCIMQNHTPICTCFENYAGDAFTECRPVVEAIQDETDPCNPSPCGANAVCDNGQCTCLPEFQGDPYFGCRPECVLSSDCPQDRACLRNKCVNPCQGACASNAMCEVINHVPMCRCPERMTGNAFVQCVVMDGKFEHLQSKLEHNILCKHKVLILK